MRRRAVVTACVCLVIGCAATVGAQQAPGALRDADTVRAALGGPAVALRDADGVAWHAVSVSLELAGLDGAPSWSVSDLALAFELRLVAALLTEGPLDETMTALGVSLDDTSLGLEVLWGPEPNSGQFVAVFGSDEAAVLLEPDLGRLREIRLRHGRATYHARVLEYGDTGRGWMPTEVEVWRDSARVARVTVTDVARSADELAPLSSGVDTSPAAVSPDLGRLPHVLL